MLFVVWLLECLFACLLVCFDVSCSLFVCVVLFRVLCCVALVWFDVLLGCCLACLRVVYCLVLYCFVLACLFVCLFVCLF